MQLWRYIAGVFNGWSQSDRSLLGSQEPALGSHLVTPRLGFVHHGIYVGGGKVIHCGAIRGIVPRGPVEEVPLSQFCRGRPLWVRGERSPKFTRQQVVARARERLGENHYRLLSNNCEHFCEWCVHDQPRSYQVQQLKRWVRLGSRADAAAADPREGCQI
jgi:hypothetical protein